MSRTITATCTQHMSDGFKNTFLCGKVATYIDPKSGRTICGIHRNVVDNFNIKAGKPLCFAIVKNPKPKVSK